MARRSAKSAAPLATESAEIDATYPHLALNGVRICSPNRRDVSAFGLERRKNLLPVPPHDPAVDEQNVRFFHNPPHLGDDGVDRLEDVFRQLVGKCNRPWLPRATVAYPCLETFVARLHGALKVGVELSSDELFPFPHTVKRRTVAFPLERPVFGHSVGRRLPTAGDDPLPALPVPDARKLRQFRTPCVKIKNEDSSVQERREINPLLVLLVVHPAQQCGDRPPDERHVRVLGDGKPGKDVIALLRRRMIGYGHRNRAVYIHLWMPVRTLEERPEPVGRMAFGKLVTDVLFDAVLELLLELALAKRHRV